MTKHLAYMNTGLLSIILACQPNAKSIYLPEWSGDLADFLLSLGGVLCLMVSMFYLFKEK